VNPASSSGAEAPSSRDRANQPDPIFPRSPGIISRKARSNFHSRVRSRSFNELKREYQNAANWELNDMHSLFTAPGFPAR
jgi:hypothetical protein